MIKYDYIIVGAGIVGLATAVKLLELDPKLNIVVIEKENQLGTH
ncbi:MAG: FAD-dependent oxidoreductase, partial [Melioribacteraceae bacterium]|nr:FAD-dependent oxidoreductase [Melioribacteraceae bacterium]